MRLARINCGARKQAGAESDAESRQNKNPENKNRFRGMNPHRDHTVLLFTFFYPDYTVGPGISPGHACLLRRLFLNGETVTAQRGSWALPPIGNSPAKCLAQVSPCPEGY